VIELGPAGGDKGGEIVAVGTPEQVTREPHSYTGHYLAPLLNGERTVFIEALSRKKRPSASTRQPEAVE
jgi:excinuclease ABC subunit A